MSIHIFTSIACNYLPKARVLAQSVKRICPDCVFHLVLADTAPAWLRPAGEPFDSVLGIGDLGIENPEQWLFQHTVVEACTGLKGFATVKLLARRDCSAVFYFDPDIVLLAPLDGLLAEFKTASVLLTPHLTEPENTLEAVVDNEFSVLQHGIYNLGFLGVNNTAEGRRFAGWWADRLNHFCYDDIPRGIFTDQRWVDLAPACFDGVRILRDPQYNVCTWNLAHREVKGSFEAGFTVNGRPLVFYHFSGLDSGAQQNKVDRLGSHMPALQQLRAWYLTECDRMGQQELGGLPWSFACFDNGQPVTPQHRKRYRESSGLQRMFPHPHATADASRSYYHWFERNSGSRVQAASRPPAPVPPVPVPEDEPGASVPVEGEPRYDVFLSICRAPAESARAAAAELKTRTHRKTALYLAGSPEEIRSVAGDPDFRDVFRPLPLPSGADHEAAFRAIAAQPASAPDFLFVTPSAIVCDLWDLRLAWTARRVAGAATVSPINDASGYTHLGACADPSADVEDTDVACYSDSLLLTPEIPRFLESCFYVNRQALAGTQAGSRTEFCERAARLRWSHILADHVYTGCRETVKRPPLYPDTPVVLDALRRDIAAVARTPRIRPAAQAVRKQLHVMHNWGGGLERWVQEYGHSDYDHDNLVLKSSGARGACGEELLLFLHVDDPTPVQRWPLNPAVKHTADRHDGYRAALSEIVHEYGIDVVIVSSLVGHSLEVFRTGLKTLMVCHDFYPFCPAISITFDSVCHHCEPARLERCNTENPHNRFFHNVPPAEWLALRPAFSRAIRSNGVRLVAPSPSVRDHYIELMPEFNQQFQVIPHGTKPLADAPLDLDYAPARRLRVVVLGSLAPHKGAELLNQALAAIVSIADVYLIGCGEYGQVFFGSAVTKVPEYQRHELPGLLKSIGPDVGLLLSVVPETFSYTLQELFELAIPVIATRLGSFADRISDGVNGFLVDPDPRALVDRLRSLANNRALLAEVHQRLRQSPSPRPEDMLAGYEGIIALPRLSSRAYFATRAQSGPAGAPVSIGLSWYLEGRQAEEPAGARTAVFRSPAPITAALRIPPPSAPLTALKIDFDPEAGVLLLHRLRLLNASGGSIWSWTHREGVLKPAGAGDLMLLGGNPGALIYPSGPHPHLILPPTPAELGPLEDGGLLEIELVCPTNEQAVTHLADAIRGSAQGGLGPEERRLLAQYLDGRSGADSGKAAMRDSRVGQLLRQLAESRRRVTELEQSLSWRITAPLRRACTILLNAHRRRRP